LLSKSFLHAFVLDGLALMADMGKVQGFVLPWTEWKSVLWWIVILISEFTLKRDKGRKYTTT
jgi:hypothetical protein